MLKIKGNSTGDVMIFDDEKNVTTLKHVVRTSKLAGQYWIARTSDDNEFVLKWVYGECPKVVFPKSFNEEFKMIVDDIPILRYNVASAVHKDGTYYLFDDDGNILLEKQKKLVILDADFVLIENEEKMQGLFNPWTKAKSMQKYTKFDICEEYIITHVADKLGVLDKRTLTEILPPIYLSVFPFGEGTFKGITINNMEVIGNAQWNSPSVEVQKIYPAKNGFYRFFSEKYGFISQDNGQLLSNILFDEATDFNEYGYALVRLFSSYIINIIDSNGKISKGKYHNHIS